MVKESIKQPKKKPSLQKPKPKKPKFKFERWYVLVAVVLIVGVFLLINVINEEKINPKEGECAGSIYLGHCFDTENEYFGCNLDGKVCNEDSWEIVLKIRLFEEADVVIYGLSDCSWCQKQLDEFGIYADYLIESGMYVDCTTSLDTGCVNITLTPTWKENGTTVHEGFIPLDQIIITGRQG